MSTSSPSSNWTPASGMVIVAEYGYSNSASSKKSSKNFLDFEQGDQFVLVKKGSQDWWLVNALEDNSISGYVPINHFSQFIPKPTSSKPEWDAGLITRDEAESRLSHPLLPDGSFLIRESKKKAGALSLSVRILGGAVKHMKVIRNHKGYSLGGVVLDPSIQMPQLEDMVQFFSITPLSRSWGTLTLPMQSDVNTETQPAQPQPTQSPPKSAGLRRKAPEPPTSSRTHQSSPPPTTTTTTTSTSTTSPSPDVNIAWQESPVGNLLDGMRLQGATDSTTSPTLDHTTKPNDVSVPTQDYPQEHQRSNPSNQMFSNSNQMKSKAIEAIDESEHPQSGELATALVQTVRDNTAISFNTAKAAVATVIDYLVSEATDPLVAAAIRSISITKLEDDEDYPFGGTDLERLQLIIEELTAMKNDAQQRSFSTHDDVEVIKDYLTEFASIVEDGDARVVTHIVANFQSTGQLGAYEIVESMVVYYQMETNTDIREQLLKLFCSLAAKDPNIYNVLQNGILPLEMVRDLTSVNPTDDTHAQRIMLTLRLTAKICCYGPLPISHYESFGASFVTCLLYLLEAETSNVVADEIAAEATSLLLAFNLHYSGNDNMVVMETISKHLSQKLVQRVMLHVNRVEDPVSNCVPGVRVLSHSTSNANSVVRFLTDVYSHQGAAANFLFRNDQNVLVDVLIREIGDRESEDQLLTEYIQLIAAVLQSANYSGNGSPYRRSDVDDVLLGLRDEVELSDGVSSLIDSIFKIKQDV